MLPMLIRLSWKEGRRGWPLLVMGLLLPPLAVALSRHQVKLLRLNVVEIMLFLLLTGVVLSAASLVAEGKDQHGYAARHFPLHPGWPWLNTICCQGLIVGLIGCSVGWWTARLPYALPLRTNILLAVVFLLATFLLTLAFARALSLPAGMAAGVLWVIAGGHEAFSQLAVPVTQNYGSPPQIAAEQTGLDAVLPIIHHTLNFGPPEMLSGPYLPLCAIVGLGVLLLSLSRKGHLLPRRVPEIILLAAVTIGFPLYYDVQLALQYKTYLQKNFETADEQYRVALQCRFKASVDGALAVLPAPGSSPYARSLNMEFFDYRTQQHVTHAFPVAFSVLSFQGETALLLEQHPGERHVTLARWGLADNRVQALLTLPAPGDAALEYLTLMSSCSPDGRYVLLWLPALQGLDRGYDLWLVDLSTRRARLVINSDRQMTGATMHVSWLRERAILSVNNTDDSRDALAITLSDGTVANWAVPASAGGRR